MQETDKWCRFDEESMQCVRCGYRAARLPTYRVCKNLVEMARDAVVQSATRRVRVPPLPIGTATARALSSIGITPERFSKVIGKPCGCEKRKTAMDAAGAAISAAVERAANAVMNAVLPYPVSEEDIAAVATSFAHSPTVNRGLREAASAGRIAVHGSITAARQDKLN